MKFAAIIGLLFLALFVTPVFSQNPTADITSPTANQILSNVYNNGSFTYPIIGTATDTDFFAWDLRYGVGPNPQSWNFLDSGSTPIVNGTFIQWQTENLAPGVYTLRLQAWDIPQHLTEDFVTITVGHFKMSQNVEQFNSGASGTVTYTSTVPAQFTQNPSNPLTQTIEIRNEAGSLVRTLVSSVARTAGTYNDVFDGKNNAGSLLPEGGYFYTSYVVNGSYSMTWDVSNQFVGGTPSWPVWVFVPPSFDSFKNLPLNYSFDLVSPARITLGFSTINLIQLNCNSPQYCVYVDRYAATGLHLGSWAGTDSTGAFRPDLHYGHVTAFRSNFPKNAVVIFGIKPTITNLSVSPPIYTPSTGQNQTISFTLATYQSQAAPTVVVSIKNSASNTVVRTITLSNVAAGNVNVPWDGKATNANLISPDMHLVTVTVTDAIGNQEVAQIFTTVRY